MGERQKSWLAAPVFAFAHARLLSRMNEWEGRKVEDGLDLVRLLSFLDSRVSEQLRSVDSGGNVSEGEWEWVFLL